MVYVISVNEDVKKTSHGSYSLLREILILWGFEGENKRKFWRKKNIYIFNYFMLTLNCTVFNPYFEFIFESNIF